MLAKAWTASTEPPNSPGDERRVDVGDHRDADLTVGDADLGRRWRLSVAVGAVAAGASRCRSNRP